MRYDFHLWILCIVEPLYKVHPICSKKKSSCTLLSRCTLCKETLTLVFKYDFHCSRCSRLTFLDSSLILYDQTLSRCFHFYNHPFEAKKSTPSTPSSLAICLAFPCKIGPLIGYLFAWAITNHLHKITLMSLYLTILAFDK
jgi:hypothetical protein